MHTRVALKVRTCAFVFAHPFVCVALVAEVNAAPDASVGRVVWHPQTNQIICSTSKGGIRVMYDPAISDKGAMLSAGRSHSRLNTNMFLPKHAVRFALRFNCSNTFTCRTDTSRPKQSIGRSRSFSSYHVCRYDILHAVGEVVAEPAQYQHFPAQTCGKVLALRLHFCDLFTRRTYQITIQITQITIWII